MEPQFKSVLWFANQEGENNPYTAAIWSLNDAGVKLNTNSSAKFPYSEGILSRPDGCPIKICLFPLLGKLSNQAEAIAKNANAILLSGTCTGRPGEVKLGDVIGVTSSYHMDRGAKHHFDGRVDFNISPVFASEAAKASLISLQKTKLEHAEAIPVSIETRRDWVLDHLNTAKMALPKAEFFPLATDPSLEAGERNKQWQKCVIGLKEEGLISVENGQIALTSPGVDYCSKNVLASFVEQSKDITVNVGTIVTSSSKQANLQKKEDWTKFDTLSPVIGLDNDAYDMLYQYPNLIVVKAVKRVGQEKVEGDKNNLIQKAAARALMQVILKL